ncbi:class I adenylate-forming enzyme family protein [Sphingosinicella microcystinivorans]|uniref:Acyl-CoA synthetase (AMP-forming)/AMP-acid ligase II n=1 Tax=Sphingosinicella microcystinivorans TaxID=335406 RepID=A0AAD1D5V2_SPHMI|nr:AMP-binding protein [Sphingosinicella microcystinivorans]RKS91512.1 acyl-CoA synthetase (AMP-forming)/AMP-acid ligase II [Sphingosinicella microcystinivorans]BBE34491.1 substrate-CoA ligase [Sphingosinicella microcystinivorans]
MQMPAGSDLVRSIERLPDAVAAYAEAAPDREAIIFGDLHLSYSEFDREIDRYARALIGAGIATGDRVAMIVTPRPEFMLMLLGAMRAGAVWVGVNPKYRREEMRHVLGDCQPKLLVSILQDPAGRRYDDDLRDLACDVAASAPLVTIGGILEGISQPLDAFLAAGDGLADVTDRLNRTSRRDPVSIVYTSGSTGKPKGAVLSHDSFFHSYKALAETFVGHAHLRAGHRVICNLPTNHVGCQSDVCGNCLIDGGTIVFMETFDPAGVLETTEREKITILGGLPLMHQAVFDHPDIARRNLGSVKVIAWGGAPMPAPLLRRLEGKGYFFSLHYGLTEGGSINSVNPPDADFTLLTETIGHHDHNNAYRVVDPDGAPVSENGIGEVQIKGPGVMLGYFNNPEATAAAFTADGWFRTGDQVKVLPGGNWRFVGRSVEMFKSGGYNVYPREVELALEEHPGVAAAAVIPVADPRYDEVGWAFVIPAPGAAIDEVMLRSFASTRLANYKVPKSFQIREALPLLPIGKVDKHALRDEVRQLSVAR